MMIVKMTSILATCSIVIMMGRILNNKDCRKLVPVVQSTASLAIAAQVYSDEFPWVWFLFSIMGDAPLIWVLAYANYISVINILVIIIIDSLHLVLLILVVASHSIIQKWIMLMLSILSYLPVLFFIYGDVELDTFIKKSTRNRRIDRMLSIGNYMLVSWAAYPIMNMYDMAVHGNIRISGMIIIDIFNKIGFPLWIIFAP